MPAPCGKFSTTSANRRSRRKLPRRAGGGCGRQEWFGGKRATIHNGICRHSLHRISSSISASPGDEQIFPRRGCACAFGSLRGRPSVRGGKFLAFSRVREEEFDFFRGIQHRKLALTGVRRSWIL